MQPGGPLVRAAIGGACEEAALFTTKLQPELLPLLVEAGCPGKTHRRRRVPRNVPLSLRAMVASHGVIGPSFGSPWGPTRRPSRPMGHDQPEPSRRHRHHHSARRRGGDPSRAVADRRVRRGTRPHRWPALGDAHQRQRARDTADHRRGSAGVDHRRRHRRWDRPRLRASSPGGPAPGGGRPTQRRGFGGPQRQSQSAARSGVEGAVPGAGGHQLGRGRRGRRDLSAHVGAGAVGAGVRRGARRPSGVRAAGGLLAQALPGGDQDSVAEAQNLP